jgi:hypothetical protein
VASEETHASIPAPASLKRLEHETKQINLSVLIVGDQAEGMIRHVWSATNGKGSDQLIDGAGGPARYTYLPLRLGDIRGWTTRLHLYAFDTGTGGLDGTFESYAANADALLITSNAARARQKTGIDRLKARGRPVAECGRNELDPTPTACAMPALKQLSKRLLTELRDSPNGR